MVWQSERPYKKRTICYVYIIFYITLQYNELKKQEMNLSETSVLLIYTGGTIGMIHNEETGTLESFNFKHLMKHIPELNKCGVKIDSYVFDKIIDSSDMNPEVWVKLVGVIRDNYDKYTGFVILHGTDTMAYTASALSFMLQNLSKPVILTGSQLPIGDLRTDGKENLLTSIEIAGAVENGEPIVQEVCIFFENHLMRGNRTIKQNAENFNAFHSCNYPNLADVGIHIKYEQVYFMKNTEKKPLVTYTGYDPNVVVLTLFPGIQENVVRTVFSIPGIRGIILKTFGTGNAPSQGWLLDLLNEANARGVVIVNVTQCIEGAVDMSRYKTGMQLLSAGVISGRDITTESALAKLMILLGNEPDIEKVREKMACSIAGEIS